MIVLEELRIARRRLAGSPAFAIGAALLLGLGVGATTTLYSITDAVLLQSLPFPHADQLVRLRMVRPGTSAARWSEAEYLTIESRTRTLGPMAAYDDTRSVNLSGPDGPMQVRAAAATTGLSDTVGVGLLVGRFFSPEEERPGASPVVVLSEAFWRSAFGADMDIVGALVSVDGRPSRVIGVLPGVYATLFPSVEVWTPLGLDRVAPDVNSGQYLDVIGRSRETGTIAALQPELDRVASQLTDEGLTRYAGSRVAVTSLRDDLVAGVRRELSVVFAIAGVVLLAICFNIAGLLLARASRLRRELAVRACLGASDGRLVVAALAEAIWLAALGLAVGCGLALAGTAVAARYGADLIPRASEVHVNLRTVFVAGSLGAATMLVFGLFPAVAVLRGLRVAQLARGQRGASGPSRPFARGTIVVVQLAVSAALVVGAGALVRSLHELGQVRLGFDVERVASFRIRLSPAVYRTAADADRFLNEMLDSFRTIPGVRSVGATNGVPMDGRISKGFAWTSAATRDGVLPAELEMRWASADYFDALGIRLLDGRAFTRADAAGSAMVTVLSRSLADALWPGQSAVGRQWKLGRLIDETTPWRTVVGIVEDVRIDGPQGPLRPVAYFPHNHLGIGREIQVAVAGVLTETTLVDGARRRLAQLDPTLPIYDAQTMTRLLDRTLALNRLSTRVVIAFAVLTLVLAAIGLYGLAAYAVAERTQELAIRSALGAGYGRLVMLIVREGLLLSALGVGPGLVGGIGVARLLGGLIHGVTASDPVTLGAAGAAIVGVAVLATLVPATRGASTDPARVLRSV